MSAIELSQITNRLKNVTLMIEQIIKKRMNLLGLTQKELADKAGLTTAQISLFFNGSSTLNQKSLESLLSILDLNIEMYEKRFELAKKVAATFIEKELKSEDVCVMSKSLMAKESGESAIMLFYDIEEKYVNEIVKTRIVDYESTFAFFKAMVIQMMTSNLKFTGSAYSTSWNKLTSKKQPFAASIATAAAVMGPILPLGLLGLSVLGMSLFAKTSLVTPFEILAKSMLKRSNK